MRWCPREHKPEGGSSAALIHDPTWLHSTRARPQASPAPPRMGSWTPARGPSHPLASPSPPALNLPQNQGLF